MTLSLELVSLVLSLVALIVTVLGVFASLFFYREGMKTQALVGSLLAKVEAKVEVISRDVGGMMKEAWSTLTGRFEGSVQAQAQEDAAERGTGGPIQALGNEIQEKRPPGSSLSTLFTLRGLQFANINTQEGQLFFHFGLEQEFNLFYGPGPRVVYYGHFYELDPVEVVSRVRVLLARLHEVRRQVSEGPDDPRRTRLLELLNAIEVTVLVTEAANSSRVRDRIVEFMPTDWKVKVHAMTPTDLEEELERERARMQP